MNKIYRIIWNHAVGQWVVSSELSNARGKRSRLLAAAVAVALAVPAGAALADEACTTDSDAAGTLNADGVCVADTGIFGGIGLMGALDGGTASGTGAVAVGPNSRAAGENATAIGNTANAATSGSVAIGYSAATTSGSNAVAVGYFSKAGSAALAAGTRADAAANGVALGGYATAGADRAIAIGGSAGAAAARAIAIGANASANTAGGIAFGSAAISTGGNAVSMGNNANANGNNTLSLGSGSAATGLRAAALGAFAVANGDNTVAFGHTASATGANAVAIGSAANATGQNSIALGADSVADRDNVLSVGWGAGFNGTRQIINIANGTEGFDAVNVNQLQPVIAALGGGATINAMTGTVTGPSYNVQGTDYDNVGDALEVVDSSLTLIDGRVTNIDNRVTNIEGGLNDGSIGLVRQDATSRDISVAAGTDGARIVLSGTAGDRIVSGVAGGVDDNDAVNLAQLKATGLVGQNGDSLSAVVYDAADKATVSFAGTNGTVLANVADGELSDSSRQAVNGSQLHATNTQVEQNSTDITNVNTLVTNLDGRVTTIDGRVTNVDNRVTNIENGFNDGSIGLVRQDATSRDISVAAGTDGGRIVLSGTAGDRVVSGVAAGIADNDAVNIGQLKAAGLVGADGSAVNVVAYDSAAKDSVTLGGSNATQAVKLKNVADATEDDEAVNLAQLKAAGLVGEGGQTLDAVTYDANSGRSQVTFAGANGTVLANVADGRIQTGSREAVNGGQIAALRDQLQGQIGDLDNRVTNIENNGGGSGGGDNPYFDANGNDASRQSGAAALPAADAQASGASAVAAGTGASASGNASVAVGANSEAKAENAVALGAGSVADRDNTVSVGRAGGERQVTNVAAGVRDTDAVNVSQLNQRLAEAKDYTDQRMDDMWNGVNDRIDHANRQANRGIAGASALVQVTPYLPGKTVLNAGMATYRGESAMGVGISRWSDNGRVNINAGVSMARGDSAIFRVGVGVVLGD